MIIYLDEKSARYLRKHFESGWYIICCSRLLKMLYIFKKNKIIYDKAKEISTGIDRRY